MAWVSSNPRAMTHMQSYSGSVASTRVSSPRRRRRGERDAKPERQADSALLSWRVGQGNMQSGRLTDVEMKEVIKHRGKSSKHSGFLRLSSPYSKYVK